MVSCGAGAGDGLVATELKQQIRNTRALAPVHRLLVGGRLEVLDAFRFTRSTTVQKLVSAGTGTV